MTLLTIVTEALAEVGETNIPTSIVNNSDPVAIKSLAMMQGIGRDLMKSFRWPSLKTTYTFPTVAGTSAYALPTCFRRFSPLTHWDRTSHWPLNGPATDAVFQQIKSGFVTVSSRFWFRIEGSNFVLAPTPTDVRTIAFDYYKNTWCASSLGNAQSKFAADTDVTTLLPNNEAEDSFKLGLIYKWKASNGVAYAEDKALFLASVEADLWDAQPADMIDVSGIPRAYNFRGNIPDSGYGS